MTLLQRAEDIGAEIRTRLLTLTVAQGAETNIGTSVLMGKRAIDDTQIPCIVVLEGDDTPERANARTDYQVMQRYALLAYLPCDPDNPSVAAHKAIRDMKRAIFTTGGKADHRLGDRVKVVEYLGRDIGPRADGAAFVLAIIEVGVSYVENVATP